MQLTLKKFSPEINDQIIREWYQGYSRAEIQAHTNVSGGYISDLIQKEKQLIGEGNVEALRRLAAAVGKEGYTLVDVVRAIRFLNACRIRTDIDDEELIDRIPRIEESCNKNNIKLADLPLDTEIRAKKVRELEDGIASLQEETKQEEKHLDDALKKHNLTEQSLQRFDRTMGMLERLGLPVNAEQPVKLANALANAEAAGQDVKLIVARISEQRSLKQENAQLKSENLGLDNKVIQKNRLLEQQDLEIQRNATIIHKVHELEQLGFRIVQLKILHSIIIKVAVDNGIDGPASVEKFFDDIRNGDYDSKVGFARKALENETKCKESETQHEKLKIDCAAVSDAVESMKLLNSKGVKNYEIVAIKSIVERYRVLFTVNKIEEIIKLYRSLENAINELENKRKDLLTNKLALESEAELLACEKDALKRGCHGFQEAFQRITEAFIKLANANLQNFTSTSAEFEKVIKRSLFCRNNGSSQR